MPRQGPAQRGQQRRRPPYEQKVAESGSFQNASPARRTPPITPSSPPARAAQRSPAADSGQRSRPGRNGAADDDRPEPKILFQTYFKSVSPRTYASQLKEASNGNHFLVLTEGKRDEASGEIRKIRLYVFAEDFPAFFRMLHDTAQFIKAHPVPEEVKKRRQKYWERKALENRRAATPAPAIERSAVEKATAGKPAIGKLAPSFSRPAPTRAGAPRR